MAPRKKKTTDEQKEEIDLFEKWAFASGFWIKVKGHTVDNPEYGYSTKEQIKRDFDAWCKKSTPKK